MPVRSRSAVLVALAVALAGCGPERVVYVGGPVVTLDADDTVAEALGVEGDRIAVVGGEEAVLAWAGDDARRVNLGGRALLPGFIDAHGHFPGEGVWAEVVDLRSPPMADVEKLDDLVERLRARAATTDRGEWVVGMGYDDTLLAEGRHPTRRDLDRASTEHPIAVIHVSGHLASLNSAALAASGIDADTPDPEGGLIRRESGAGAHGEEPGGAHGGEPGGAHGVPDGVLEESAMAPIEARILAPGPVESWRILREASRRYLAAGVTTAQNGYAPKFQARALGWAARLGLLPLRLVIWPDPALGDEILAGEFDIPESDFARLGAVKIVADGSIQGYTGYLSKPYHVPPGDDPGYRGYPRIPREELVELVARYHAGGLQVAVHGNGDASIDDILDAVEEAQRRHPREDVRPVVIHAQMTRMDQLDRMRALGAVPSFFSLHTFYWGDRHRRIFMGPERAARMSPAASAARRGIRFTIHCDAPVVPMEPMRLVWAAVNRRTRSGHVVGPAERIPVRRALRAVTIDAAWQHFEEADKGSLEPGKLADLVILSDNPLEVEPAELDGIRVFATIVGGERRYQAVR
jgi:predicted amidohydrolase YtcJ